MKSSMNLKPLTPQVQPLQDFVETRKPFTSTFAAAEGPVGDLAAEAAW